MNATWNGDVRQATKHTQTLKQLNNGRKIPQSGWKCDQCDLKDNLWLNLTDGAILCGRKFFDGTGGNNHAAEYYYKTKYPLAVKLGLSFRISFIRVFSNIDKITVLTKREPADPHGVWWILVDSGRS
jgi:uncharacterized UBP type Zn finger protein